MSKYPADNERAYSKLQTAMIQHRYVRIVRAIDGADVLEGYVVALGDEWLLLATSVGALRMCGWVALRVRDVASVKKLPSRGEIDLQERVLRAQNAWPPSLPRLCDVGSIAGILEMARQLGPLVEIHREKKNPWTFLVGQVTQLEATQLTLRKIDRAGEWSESRPYSLKSITGIGIGGDYVRSLGLVVEELSSL